MTSAEGRALDAVLKLHSRPGKPTRCWDLDLRCPAHDWAWPRRQSFSAVLDCPDCTYRERWYCTHCREEQWPCPTVQAIARHVPELVPA